MIDFIQLIGKYFISIFILGYCVQLNAQQIDSVKIRKQIIDALHAGETPAEIDIENNIKLPPLNTFIESAYEHPSVQIYQAMKDEREAELKMKKNEWLDYVRIVGNYQYGQLTSLTSNSDTYTPMYYENEGKKQNFFNVGVNISIPVSSFFNNKQKIRVEKAKINQLNYQYEMSVEERRLKIVEAYNEVTQSMSVLKAKSDAAVLYQAQMKISEQAFINGKISIIELSLERSRCATALVAYQEGKAAYQRAITLLEMLTNKKITK